LGKLLPFNDADISWGSGPIFRGAAFSPDGNLLAAIDGFNRIYLIDFVGRTVERISPGVFDPDGFVTSVTFSPDGNSLAVLGPKIRIIDLNTRKQTVLYDGFGYNPWQWNPNFANAMAYAPSGKVIASGGTRGGVKIWEASTGRELASWAAHEKGVNAIAFSPDGTMLATSGEDGFVRLWDRKTRAELRAVNRSGIPVFSDDGKLLAIGSRYHAEVWRLGRGAAGKSQGQKFTLDGPMDMTLFPYFEFFRSDDFRFFPHSFSFAPGGRRVLLSIGPAMIWDWTERRKTALAFPIHEEFLAFSPDGRTMATSSPQGVRLWKLPD
jgi:WD40 repeat protein